MDWAQYIREGMEDAEAYMDELMVEMESILKMRPKRGATMNVTDWEDLALEDFGTLVEELRGNGNR